LLHAWLVNVFIGIFFFCLDLFVFVVVELEF
jgi:hypothetical protein